MDKRRNPWTKVVNVVLVILITILVTSFGAEKVLVEGISQADFAQGISHRMMDTIFGAIGDQMGILGDAQEGIENSKEVKSMTSKLLDATVKEISGDNQAIEKVDIKPEMEALINTTVDKMDGKIDQRVLETIRQELTSRESEISQLIKDSVASYMDVAAYYPELAKLIKLYRVYTSNLFRVILCAVILLLIGLLCKLYGSVKVAVKNFGIDGIVAGILVICAGLAGGKILLYASERYLGRGIFMTNLFMVQGLVSVGIGLVMYIIGHFLGRNDN